jgi:hypothetical protein
MQPAATPSAARGGARPPPPPQHWHVARGSRPAAGPRLAPGLPHAPTGARGAALVLAAAKKPGGRGGGGGGGGGGKAQRGFGAAGGTRSGGDAARQPKRGPAKGSGGGGQGGGGGKKGGGGGKAGGGEGAGFGAPQTARVVAPEAPAVKVSGPLTAHLLVRRPGRGRSKSTAATRPAAGKRPGTRTLLPGPPWGCGLLPPCADPPQPPSALPLPPRAASRPQDELSGWEPAPAPLWGTFCGHLEGDWLGQYAAYTPWGGAAGQRGAGGRGDAGGGAGLGDQRSRHDSPEQPRAAGEAAGGLQRRAAAGTAPGQLAPLDQTAPHPCPPHPHPPQLTPSPCGPTTAGATCCTPTAARARAARRRAPPRATSSCARRGGGRTYQSCSAPRPRPPRAWRARRAAPGRAPTAAAAAASLARVQQRRRRARPPARRQPRVRTTTSTSRALATTPAARWCLTAGPTRWGRSTSVRGAGGGGAGGGVGGGCCGGCCGFAGLQVQGASTRVVIGRAS